MRLHIEILYDRERIRRLLQERGWRLDEGSEAARYAARHPTVRDQATARNRLHAAGLLTSSALRIEFDPHA
jgi:hypothetical protein